VTNANRYFELLGFGLYHTSVSVYGVEYSYGGHDQKLPGTVVDYKGNAAGLPLKESLPMGYTYYSKHEICQMVDRYGFFWFGVDYDPFAKNCNHFTEHLIKTLCNKHEFYYPSYVNRFTKLGSILRMWFKPL
jgi:deubiquitinase DESI2